MELTYIIIFSALGSIGAVMLGAIFLFFPDQIQRNLLPKFISFATGSLLGTAFLGLIPHAAETIKIDEVLMFTLVGILFFFMLEKYILWRHCHEDHCEVHEVSGSMILIGDAFHSFVDGIIIATSFITSIPLGLATAFSVMTHEIPQEVGDFAILIKNNYTKGRAFMLNVISGLSAILGGVLAYFFINQMTSTIPYIMTFSASSFIYIAVSDLIPSLHMQTDPKESFIQICLIVAGIVTVMFLSH